MFSPIFSSIFSQFEQLKKKTSFFNLSCMFLKPNILSNLNYNCSNTLDMTILSRNKLKSILLPKIVLTFHCLNKSASNFKFFSRSPEHFFSQLVTTILVTKYQLAPNIFFSQFASWTSNNNEYLLKKFLKDSQRN